MKLKTIIPIYALLLLTLSTPSFATSDVATPASLKKEIREIKKEAKNEIKEVRKEFKQESKSALSEFKKNKVQGLYQSIRNSLTKRFDFLQKTKTLIETRINEKSTQGKDVAAAKTKLTEYSAVQAKYITDLAAVDTKLQELLKSDEPKKNVPDLRETMNKVRTDLNSMHKILVDTLRLLVKVK